MLGRTVSPRSTFRESRQAATFRGMVRRRGTRPVDEQLDFVGPTRPQTTGSPPPTADTVHRVAGLFAGIGGIEAGLHRHRHRTELLCEIEPAAKAVLREQFPDVPLMSDVAEIDALPDATTLLAAGFPCQDLSQAGRTAGIHGKNSGLVNHIFRLLERRRVPWVLLENVSFMLRLARGAAFLHVIEELERLGYRWAYRVVDSSAFGIPQRRKRVYLVACLPGAGDPRGVLLTDDAGEPPPPATHVGRACGFFWTEGIRGLGWAVDAIPTLKGGSTIGIASPPAIWMPDGRIVTPDLRDGERLQGFPVGWTQAAGGRPGIRWKLIGNAVTVDAAAWLGERLRTPGTYQASGDRELATKCRWPAAAWSMEIGRRFASTVSAWPRRTPAPPLAKFLQFEPKLLSERATAGFFARTQVSKLRFPEGFLSAIEAHLRAVSGEPASV
jgi:DNA (cytosine-5)-methyltransferase 1